MKSSSAPPSDNVCARDAAAPGTSPEPPDQNCYYLCLLSPSPILACPRPWCASWLIATSPFRHPSRRPRWPTRSPAGTYSVGAVPAPAAYAFLLPLVARLSASKSRANSRVPRALILAPTRELVGQIESALKPLAKVAGLSSVSIFGGVSQQPQVRALRSGVDILLATPGRLEDLIQQRHCSLSDIEITVLDEADHMSDLGFLPPVKRLLAQTPARGQRMLFSATLDARVGVLVKQFLRNPVTHEANSNEPAASATAHHVLQVEQEQRFQVLADLTSAPGQRLVFTRTKHRAKALTRQLNAKVFRPSSCTAT